MTNLNDFDRALGDFLAAGPTTAPEAPVVAALAHARTTPRRPDLLGRLRPDVMSRPRVGAGVLRSGLVFAALALAVTTVGVAVIGSPPQDTSVGPEATPSAPATPATPSATVGASPSAVSGGEPRPIGSPAVPPIHVDLIEDAGNDATVDVVDESGRLVSAVAAAGATEQVTGDLRATNVSDTSVRLDWVGSPCDTIHRLTIDPTLSRLTIDRPKCPGDAIGVWRALVLTFDGPVDATGLTTAMFAGRGGVDMPTWTASGPDSAGSRYDLVVVDPGYVVGSIDPGFDPSVAPVEGEGVRIDRIDELNVRLAWSAPACATAFTLEIPVGGGPWLLGSEMCVSTESVLRMLDVGLASPMIAGELSVETSFGEP
jgi:hypothetical protein